MSDVQIMEYQPAGNNELAAALTGLEEQIEDAAIANMNVILANDNSYTETERQSMVMVEKLRLVNGLDLAAVLLRAKYINEIEHSNAVTNHPGDYANLQDLARDQGISAAELSQTLDLVNIIFPYVSETLGMPIYQLWEQIGKSNFRELTPVLKSVITGEDSLTESVRNSVSRILDDVAATATVAGQFLDDGELRRHATEQLLDDGVNLTNRELRRHIRPERTQPFDASLIQHNGTVIFVAEVDDDQLRNMQRRMGAYMEERLVSLPDNVEARQVEVARIPEVRSLLRLLEMSG